MKKAGYSCQWGMKRPAEQEHLAAAVTGQMVANSWNKEGSTS